MARPRKANRDKAFEIYKESKAKISTREIAEMLQEKLSLVNRWRVLDEWDMKLFGVKNKPGAPSGNLNAMQHGVYCDDNKILPDEFLKKYLAKGTQKAYIDSKDLNISMLDKLGHSIDILWSKILSSQKITEVKNKKDITKVKTKEAYGENSSTEEWEYQFAWDKENAALDIQSKAFERLSKMINQYEELLHKNWDLATEEQKLRIEKLKLDISKITGEENTDKNKNTKLDSILEQLSE